MVDQGKRLSNMLRTSRKIESLLGKTIYFPYRFLGWNCPTRHRWFPCNWWNPRFLWRNDLRWIPSSRCRPSRHILDHSAAHTWGTQPYSTANTSRDSPILSFLTLEKDTITFITPSKQITGTVTSGITGTHPSGGLKLHPGH